MEKNIVTLRQEKGGDLPSILPTLIESQSDEDASTFATGNVVILLEDGSNFRSHPLYLSHSPVLKKILLNIEIRLSPVYISLPGFSSRSVINLLSFLHKGNVGKKIICLINSILTKNNFSSRQQRE